MELGRRIELRLQVLGISQAELARRADIPQTTVNSLIRSGRRSTPHLVKIARELQTTPAYLAGETDDPALDAPAPTLSSEDQAVLGLYHSLESSGQKAVIEIMRTMAQAALAGTAGQHALKQPTVSPVRVTRKPVTDHASQ